VLSKITTILSALLFVGSASSALAGSHTRGEYYYDLIASRRAVSAALSLDRAGVLGRTAGPVIAEEKGSLAVPRPAVVQSASVCRAMSGTLVWIKLTAPGGGPIHINVEQVTSVRSDTQILGANAQLDLTSGKFQGVREDVDQVMQMITAAAGVRAGECA
jgi:hypothetical protein